MVEHSGLRAREHGAETREKRSGWLFWLTALCMALLAVSASIAVPILFRPFYALHIFLLDLPGLTGLSAAEIARAYGEMMDYCLGLRPDFSAGALPWSLSGADHFADVRALFLLDLAVLACSAAGAAGLFALRRVTGRRAARPLGRGACFWAAALLVCSAAALGLWIAVDFDGAFVAFHTLFFPGKDNWLFDGRTDPIIYLLPETFFRNCAILILGLLALWCAGMAAWDLRKKRASRNRERSLPRRTENPENRG